MKLIHFDDVDALNELLAHIGITSDLGTFLAEHLAEVLSKQHPDVVIDSIEFVGADDCSADGAHISDGPIVQVDSICLPINIHVVLASNNRTHQLELLVRIMANSSDGTYDVTTDVIIERQSIV